MAADKSRKVFRFGWAVLAFFAVANGLEALRYALPTIPFPTPLPNLTERHTWLVSHAIFSGLAILSGPWQFLSPLRRRSLKAHRWIGRIYCGAVLLGWLTSLPIAAHAQTGAVASSGFLALGAVWIATTAAGFFTIRAGQVQAHRRWMIRSFALTAAAITLRIYLPIAIATHMDFSIAYGAIAWLCWIPNLLFAERLIQRGLSGGSAAGQTA